MYDLKQNLYLSGIGFDGNLKTNTIKASVDKWLVYMFKIC